jgi:hypothetical protein
VLAATDYVMACFEIVDSRVKDWKVRIQDTVADNASCGLFVLGAEHVSPEGLDFPNLQMRVYKNDALLSQGLGSAALGSPVNCVTWLANTLGEFGPLFPAARAAQLEATMSKKIKAAIIGSGNIGTDLLYKALRSEVIEPVWMVGIEEASEGLARAKQLGLKCTHEGVAGLEPHIVADNIQICWDATSAYVHGANNDIVKKYGVKMIDLTPAAIGPFCVPPVNLAKHGRPRR